MALIAFMGVWAADTAQPDATLSVSAGASGTAVSPNLFGAFFEDINYGADGGLYAELAQNRSFESRIDGESWKLTGDSDAVKLSVLQANPLNAKNLRYAKVEVAQAGQGISNGGFGGMHFASGDSYSVSAYLRSDDPTATSLELSLVDEADGSIVASFEAKGVAKEWKRFSATLVAAKTTSSGRLEIRAKAAGSFELDLASVFPVKTYKDRANGLRPDLAGMVADLKPGFFRFPGGCVVEGRNTSVAYRWKDTIGDIAERKDTENVWGYRQSYGLGFYEYLQYCEDIGAEPLPVINCGMACQARGGDFVPLSELGPWIQDALDLIEYANGPADSKWGAVRAASGHPAPFGLKYLAIGNEQWGNEYYPRYQKFAEAIKAAQPEIKLIFAAGPVASGSQFDDAWAHARQFGVDLVDEHYYMTPEWFLSNTKRYDGYDRKGPKVFLGEYAAQTPTKVSNLYAALAESAFMTGLERNGDVVELASYAPLFARSGNTQWVPDMIWFTNDSVYGTPTYYAQKLFSQNKSAVTLPYSLATAPSISKEKPLGGGIGLGSWATRVDYKDIKVTDKDGRVLYQPSLDSLEGWLPGLGMWGASGGSISQRSSFKDCRLVHNADEWKDYTLSLKACKRSGSEGMLVMFGLQGGGFYRWNLGGWGNTASAVEKGDASSSSVVSPSVPLKVESDRWYELRIELRGDDIRCYLDGALVHQIKASYDSGPIYAHAGRDAAGNYIVKLVNLVKSPRTVRVLLDGAKSLEGSGTATVLSNTNALAVNSFSDPQEVYPKTIPVSGVSADFSYSLEANSLTILKLPIK
jgi:Alpha-L-arabinofuranosidase